MSLKALSRDTKISVKVDGIWCDVDEDKLRSFKNIESVSIRETLTKEEFIEQYPHLLTKENE